ncbi:tetratricopeptide repeat protein [Candidatus Poribacteria bacterium]
MEECHESCDNHIHADHMKHRTRWVFSLIFIPVCIFLIRTIMARQMLYRASAYEASNMHQESIRQYKKALFMDGDNAEGWNGLAAVYKLAGDMEKTISAYRKALEAEPQNRKALYSLGMRLALDKQQYEEAAGYWNQVRELGPESVEEREKYQLSYHRLSLDALATCYKRLNDADREADILEELRHHYPDSSKVREENQAIDGNPSNIGIGEKSSTSP